MKEGRTLQSLASELERQAEVKQDFVVPVGELYVHTNGTTAMGMSSTDHGFPLSEIAHGQLAEYAGVPKQFYDRLRGSSMTLRVPRVLHSIAVPEPTYSDPIPDTITLHGIDGDEALFDLMINRLLRQKAEAVTPEGKTDEKRLIRTLDGKARAFLSSSYNPDLDNFDVYRIAARVIGESDLGPSNVVSCEVTERKLYLKVVSPKVQAVIQPSNLHPEHGGHHFLKEPQLIQAGFVLSNSETGMGALRVDTIVYKLMCTNLWVTETTHRQRHLGPILQSDEDGQIYRSDTRVADAQARLLKLRDHVAAALDEQQFMLLAAKIQQTAELPLGSNIVRTVDVTARKFGLSQSERESVVRNLIEGTDLSIWGLSNAITQAAGMVESYDRATELETIGGKLFSLTQTDVKEIVNA